MTTLQIPVSLTPSGASSGALAIIASPFAFHADAVAAFLLHFAAGGIQLAAMCALAFRLENAITVFIAHKIVLALASWKPERIKCWCKCTIFLP